MPVLAKWLAASLEASECENSLPLVADPINIEG